jgi:membrane associated rhomboid family serine protease
MQNKFSISNLLIIISMIVTFISFNYLNIIEFWMNTYYINSWDYIHYILQYFMYNFLHWSYMHLFSNILFIYLFWNLVENIITKNKFILFFIFITIFNWIWLSLFSDWNTIWISWFALAILVYYTLELKSLKNPEYKWWITAIIISIWIWLMPWISLLWHLFWAIWWAIFYYLNKDFFFKQKVWLITKIKQTFSEPKIIQPENIKKN